MLKDNAFTCTLRLDMLTHQYTDTRIQTQRGLYELCMSLMRYHIQY